MPRKIETLVGCLLHFNGANNSTTFTDETGKPWTPAGTAKISTARSKFGGASAVFDSSDDFISTPPHVDTAFGYGSFTMDFWIYRNGTLSNPHLFSQGISGNFSYHMYLVSSSNLITYVFSSNGAITLSSTTALQIDTWYHIAVIRDHVLQTLNLYVNGTLEHSLHCDKAKIHYPGSNNLTSLIIGNDGIGVFGGYMDEFRISKGIVRWTSNFTPPISEYVLVNRPFIPSVVMT